MISVYYKWVVWIEWVEVMSVVYIAPVFGDDAVDGRFIFAVMGYKWERFFHSSFLGGGLCVRSSLLEHESELSEDM